MKTISKLKLTQLSKSELEARQMNCLLGGNNHCSCGCGGPSLTHDNARANAEYNYTKTAGLLCCSNGMFFPITNLLYSFRNERHVAYLSED